MKKIVPSEWLSYHRISNDHTNQKQSPKDEKKPSKKSLRFFLPNPMVKIAIKALPVANNDIVL